MKKITLSIVTLFVLVLTGWIFILLWKENSDKVMANPDYICKKSVSDMPCEISSCDEWSGSWTRTCYWERTTEVSYYLIRTDCEAWYTKVSNWWNVWWNSWRQTSDYVSGSATCEVEQVDVEAPIWIISE
jgi:hypothetical protein